MNPFYRSLQITLLTLGLLIFIASCSIFRRETGYGCPSGGANIGAERLLNEKGALKKSQRSKFRGK